MKIKVAGLERLPRRVTVSLSSNPLSENSLRVSMIFPFGRGISAIALSKNDSLLSLLPISTGKYGPPA